MFYTKVKLIYETLQIVVGGGNTQTRRTVEREVTEVGKVWNVLRQLTQDRSDSWDTHDLGWADPQTIRIDDD